MKFRSSSYFAGRSPEDAQKRAEARKRRNVATTKARQDAQRDEYFRAGLNSSGKRFATYETWKHARGVAAKRGPSWRWRVDVLDRSYPDFFSRLDDETSLSGIEARKARSRAKHSANTALYSRRRNQYRREDVVSGDIKLTNYQQFVGYMERYRRGSPHQNSEVTAALRAQYPAWTQQYRANRSARRKKAKAKEKGSRS